MRFLKEAVFLAASAGVTTSTLAQDRIGEVPVTSDVLSCINVGITQEFGYVDQTLARLESGTIATIFMNSTENMNIDIAIIDGPAVSIQVVDQAIPDVLLYGIIDTPVTGQTISQALKAAPRDRVNLSEGLGNRTYDVVKDCFQKFGL